MKRPLSITATLLMLSTSTALADVPADQAARLGKDLTPMGAEMAGTGDVPAWTGGMTSPPAGISFDPKTQNPPNPFPNDKPRFTITSGNMGQYADRLDEGQKAMLKRYPDFTMPVYESRRTCTTPQFVFAATKNNAIVGKLTQDGEGVQGAIMGAPFPIFNNAMELIWDEKLRWLTHKATRTYTAAPVQRNGSYTLIKIQDEVIYRWGDPTKKSAEELENISLKYISNTIGPPRLAGNVILVHESLNSTADPRKAWSYSPGTRRTRRAPDIAYDNPGFNTDGMTTADSFGGFNGAMDRYDWTVKGRSVKFIPYNAYNITNAKYADLIKPGHLNQDLARYEPHRVWMVEATLKPGQRHSYARRVLYLDEDTYTPTGVEIYDGRGQLWRYQELHVQNFYQVPACFATVGSVYDLIDGRYLVGGLIAEEPPINFNADELNDARYTPEALRTLGVR